MTKDKKDLNIIIDQAGNLRAVYFYDYDSKIEKNIITESNSNTFYVSTHKIIPITNDDDLSNYLQSKYLKRSPDKIWSNRQAIDFAKKLSTSDIRDLSINGEKVGFEEFNRAIINAELKAHLSSEVIDKIKAAGGIISQQIDDITKDGAVTVYEYERLKVLAKEVIEVTGKKNPIRL
jgi:hypothetical protein